MTLIVETSQVLPVATIGITFRAGRADEPSGRDGLARLTAKMKRRVQHGGEDVEHRFDRLGAELDEQVGLGATTFSCEVLARSVDAAAGLLAEVIADARLDADELGRLKRQSKAALLRTRDDDALLCGRALRRNLFAGHPHGQRVLGTLDGIDAVEVADVAAFAARHYTRDNAVVHISGDVHVRRAEAVAERLLSALPAGESLPYPATTPADPQGRRMVIVDKKLRTQTQVGIGTLGVDVRDGDYIPFLVANAAFGGTFTSRLTREIRSERGWSYGASSSMTVGRVREAFTMWTAPAAADAAACLALELLLLEAWQRDGIDQDELEQCKSFLSRSYAFEIDTPHKRMLQKLERFLLDLPDDFHDRYLERLDAVTCDTANQAIRRHIHPENLWIATVCDPSVLRHPLEDACGGLAETRIDPIDLP